MVSRGIKNCRDKRGRSSTISFSACESPFQHHRRRERPGCRRSTGEERHDRVDKTPCWHEVRGWYGDWSNRGRGESEYSFFVGAHCWSFPAARAAESHYREKTKTPNQTRFIHRFKRRGIGYCRSHALRNSSSGVRLFAPTGSTMAEPLTDETEENPSESIFHQLF